MATDILSYLSSKRYLGRGILVARSKDEKKSLISYFLMGRSLNSQNRRLIASPDGAAIEIVDPTEVTDSSLILYHPMRETRNRLVITNGDQTETICRALDNKEDWLQALERKSYEPDGPIYTPRISTVLSEENPFSFTFSILRKEENGVQCCRDAFSHVLETGGQGWLLHTYEGEYEVKAFQGEPVLLTVDFDDPMELGEAIWNNLNEKTKVSLMVCEMDWETGERQIHFWNKRQ